MKRGTWEQHCSNCAFYRITDQAGLGVCHWWHKNVSWSSVCDRWKSL